MCSSSECSFVSQLDVSTMSRGPHDVVTCQLCTRLMIRDFAVPTPQRQLGHVDFICTTDVLRSTSILTSLPRPTGSQQYDPLFLFPAWQASQNIREAYVYDCNVRNLSTCHQRKPIASTLQNLMKLLTFSNLESSRYHLCDKIKY